MDDRGQLDGDGTIGTVTIGVALLVGIVVVDSLDHVTTQLWLLLAAAMVVGYVAHELTHYVVAVAAGADDVRLTPKYVSYRSDAATAALVSYAPWGVAIAGTGMYLLRHGIPDITPETMAMGSFLLGYTVLGGREDYTLGGSAANHRTDPIRSLTIGDDDVPVVETADGLLEQMLGLRFVATLPTEYAMVFRFPSAKPRLVDMLFVPTPLDVVWVVDGTVVAVERLRPWIGYGRHECDLLIELPAGSVEPTDGDDIIVHYE